MPTLAVPDPSLVVLVGPAGSGKTTFAARHFAPDEALSSDGFRAIVGRDEADQEASAAAFSVLHRQLAKRLNDGRLTVVDATNLSKGARSALLRLARACRVPAVAIVLDLPRDVVLDRNSARTERVVDRGVILDQLSRLREVVDRGLLERERFDAVHRIAAPAELDAVRIERRPG
ncbi:MAG TPA: AAA family ATPase [Candidatus Limnocylindrales bacterium]|jgi:protein phosphatase|nr:AAA family ATPase [Candidatus Limnocylindrales bacterium]